MKIKIVSPVEHDGKALKVGDVVGLPDDVAQRLVDGGAAELPGRAQSAPSFAPASASASASASAQAAATAPAADAADQA